MSGPILLTGDGRVRLKDSRMCRDLDINDDCDHFDTDQRTLSTCYGDGHWRCKQCQNLTPNPEFGP